jgi:DNA-binding NarL/FixJ family response regulator
MTMSNVAFATSHMSGAEGRFDTTTSDTVTPRAQSRAILLLDHQSLTRECVAQQLMMLLPDTEIVPVARIEDIPSLAGQVERFSVAVIHKHASPIESQEISSLLLHFSDLTPKLPVVLLSDTDDANEIVRAFGLGIRGYIPINLSIRHAVDAIRLVGAGGNYVPSSVLSLSTTQQSTAPGPFYRKGAQCAERFTPRQMEVLQRLWQGKQNKTIAYDLDMCESTVKVHIRHIMKKLNARNRTQVVLLTRSLNESGSATVES